LAGEIDGSFSYRSVAIKDARTVVRNFFVEAWLAKAVELNVLESKNWLKHSKYFW
jgi:hypothetical protein